MTTKNDSFVCPMAWLAIGISAPGYLRLCCNSDASAFVSSDDGNIEEFLKLEDIKDYYNNNYMMETRRKMMKGEVPKACVRCRKLEKSGVESPRLGYLKSFSSEMDEALSLTDHQGKIEPRIRYIDFALGNKCNLKCRMCLPEVAYGIARDWDQINMTYDKEVVALGKEAGNAEVSNKFRSFFKSILPDLTQIQFTSGEPLISQHHEEILRIAIESQDANHLDLTYFTNLTSIPNYVLQGWPHFRNVKIYVSIEGVGALNDYIRHPSKWESVSSNLKKLLFFVAKYPHIRVQINTVFQAYNVLGVADLIRYLIPFSESMCPIPNFNVIWHPSFLNPSVLPDEIKIEAEARIEEVLKQHKSGLSRFSWNVEALRNHVKSMKTLPVQEESRAGFLYYTRRMDELRKQSLVDLVPEFKDFLSPDV